MKMYKNRKKAQIRKEKNVGTLLRFVIANHHIENDIKRHSYTFMVENGVWKKATNKEITVKVDNLISPGQCHLSYNNNFNRMTTFHGIFFRFVCQFSFWR